MSAMGVQVNEVDKQVKNNNTVRLLWGIKKKKLIDDFPWDYVTFLGWVPVSSVFSV